MKVGFDKDYARLADVQGVEKFSPKTGDQYWLLMHHLFEKKTGPDYEGAKSSTTLSVNVP